MVSRDSRFAHISRLSLSENYLGFSLSWRMRKLAVYDFNEG